MLDEFSTRSSTVAARILMSAADSEPREDIFSPPFFGTKIEPRMTSCSLRVTSRRVGLGEEPVKMFLNLVNLGVPSKV